MSATITLRTEAAGPAHTEGLVALFEAAGSPCYCRFWHFTGTNNAWLERTALAAHENRAELEAALAQGSDEARGIVAIATIDAEPPRVVGWLKVAPAASVTKAYDRRLYRKLPCFEGDRSGVYLIGCALVHPEHRRRGVAAALVGSAVHFATLWGASALEALPRRSNEPMSDEELWTGPMGAFTAHGFEVVNEFEPYPVLRRTLSSG
ncbi:MAG: GNAT family N-acetyltransferase [Byssovorax sp.]